jgi:hypothetical protein
MEIQIISKNYCGGTAPTINIIKNEINSTYYIGSVLY